VDDLWSAPKDTTPGDLPPGPIILHLFAGPDTPSALDYTIQTEAPWLTPFLVSIDILRDSKGHDLLQAGLYHQLMRKAARGEIVAILGGPNCRTWTILLHMPLPDGSPGHPLRGRHEPDCWGLHDLTNTELIKVDSDSLLLLRMLAIYTMAKECGHNPAFLLEHPADPRYHSQEPTANQCSSIWATKALQTFASQYDLTKTTFPQSPLGKLDGPKWTTALHAHMPKIRRLGQLSPTHSGEGATKHSSELARWAPGFNKAVAHSIMATLPTMAHWTNAADSDANTDNVAVTATQPTRDIHVTTGHKSRPIRDGGGKPSPGRRHPIQRRHPLRVLGQALTAGTIAGSTKIQPHLIPATRDLQAGTAKEYPYPDTILEEYQAKICNHTSTLPTVSEGQPFLLETIAALARQAGDPDHHFPLQCQHGLPLGVEENLPDAQHV
jgi:hypothetical protein